jgi:hypothetical protein
MEDYKIIREKNNIYKIIFANPEIILIKSLTKTNIINGATVTDDFMTIKFKASNVKTFEEYKQTQLKINGSQKFKISTTTQLVESLTKQLTFLIESYSHTFIGYNTEDLIVIDENKFIFLGSSLMREIDMETGNILISHPFTSQDFFLSPELQIIKTIPSYVNFKTTYFSLACLIINCLDPENTKNQNTKSEEFTVFLSTLPIKDTRLFWFLSRCILANPKKRELLFI